LSAIGVTDGVIGRPAIEATLRQTLARAKPANFRIPPRRVSRAG
jgi:hypothetical protein